MPGHVLRLESAFDDPIPSSHGGHRSVSSQSAPAIREARRSSHALSPHPRRPGSGPKPVDAGLACAFLTSLMSCQRIRRIEHEATNHITSPAFRSSRSERRGRPRLGADRRLRLLIFYHVGMLYVSWGPHQKRASYRRPGAADAGPQPCGWRCFFWVSGAATPIHVAEYRVGPLLRSRSTRLLIH